MAEFQTRGSAAGDPWSAGPPRPAGLYGELPPLPAPFAANGRLSALTRKPRRNPKPAD